MQKILITELEYNKAVDTFKQSADFECIKAPVDEKELAAMVRKTGAKYVVVGTAKYTRELYDALPPGGVIARFGVGHDGIDKELAKHKGIYCVNTPGALDDSVAECAVGMLLLAARRFVSCASDNKHGLWKNRVGVELAGKTLAIVGCGNIGSKVARIAGNGFGMKVIGFDVVQPKEAELYDSFTQEFEEAVQNADFVTLHIPDIAATRNFLGAEELRMLKKNAWVINTARGGVLDEDALYTAVENGQIGGAVLDVFKVEPYQPETRDLRRLDNVIMLPHLGSSTQEACRRMALASIENIRLCEAGRITEMNHLYPVK